MASFPLHLTHSLKVFSSFFIAQRLLQHSVICKFDDCVETTEHNIHAFYHSSHITLSHAFKPM